VEPFICLCRALGAAARRSSRSHARSGTIGRSPKDACACDQAGDRIRGHEFSLPLLGQPENRVGQPDRPQGLDGRRQPGDRPEIGCTTLSALLASKAPIRAVITRAGGSGSLATECAGPQTLDLVLIRLANAVIVRCGPFLPSAHQQTVRISMQTLTGPGHVVAAQAKPPASRFSERASYRRAVV
jgi:hypothetical protein